VPTQSLSDVVPPGDTLEQWSPLMLVPLHRPVQLPAQVPENSAAHPVSQAPVHIGAVHVPLQSPSHAPLTGVVHECASAPAPSAVALSVVASPGAPESTAASASSIGPESTEASTSGAPASKAAQSHGS